MKTWRQGVVARLVLPGRPTLYLHCHTYPLARIYRAWDGADLGDAAGWLRVRLEDFGVLGRVGEYPLTAADRRVREPAAWSEWTDGPPAKHPKGMEGQPR